MRPAVYAFGLLLCEKWAARLFFPGKFFSRELLPMRGAFLLFIRAIWFGNGTSVGHNFDLQR